MKRYANFILSVLSISSGMLISMQQQGPMNAEWFYAQNHPFSAANALHQERQWEQAEVEYEQILKEGDGTEYDQKMAKLNLAACLMAQQKPTEHWGSFDALIGIPQEKQLSVDAVECGPVKKSVLVRTDQVGIGDIVHFLETANILKKRTGWDVTVSVRPFLKGTISNVVSYYGCELISEKDEQPNTDYTTHIVGLLGHLQLKPAETKPSMLLHAPDRAMNAVQEQLKDALAQGKTVVVGFAGEDRQATLIGGKKLPLSVTDYGRQINPTALQLLLKKNPNIVFVDCGTPSSRVPVDKERKNQYMLVAKEEQPFDTLVALAVEMSLNKKILGIAADQGPSNVFARSLDKDGQQRMAFIIPNPGQYDMRMEGAGEQYQQMISDCLVVKSKSFDVNDQVLAIEQALQEMMNK